MQNYSSSITKSPISINPTTTDSTHDPTPLSKQDNFIIVWHSDPVECMTDHTQQMITKLKCIIGTVTIFDNCNTCADYVYSIGNRQLILIVNESNGAQLVRKILHVSHLTLVYVFCADQSIHPPWAAACKSIRCIFVDQLSICQRIEMDTRDKSLSWNVADALSINPGTLNNSNKQDAQFMYTQLLKYVLTEMTYPDNHMDKLIEFLQKDRPITTENIEQFRKNALIKPIWCYTKYAFVFETLNAALRTCNAEVLYIMGAYMKALHQQLVQLYTSIAEPQNFKLYRGVVMTTSNFEKMRQKQNGLLSISNFLSTSRSKKVSDFFNAGSRLDCISILFEIDIDQSRPTDVAYASIQSVSEYSDEEEYLFTMGSVFRIKSIDKPNENGVRCVHLSLTTDHDSELSLVSQYLRSQLSEPDLLKLCAVLFNMGLCEESAKICETAINSSSDSLDLFWFHFLAGYVYSTMKDHKAHRHFELALEYYSRLPVDIRDISAMKVLSSLCFPFEDVPTSTMINLQSMFQNNNEFYDSSQYREGPIVTKLLLSFIADREGRLQDALSYAKEAYNLGRDGLPSKHPTLALSLSQLANVHSSLHQTDEMLFCQEESMKIMQDSMLPDHPLILHSHGVFHDIRDRIDHSVSESYEQFLTTAMSKWKSASNQSPMRLLTVAGIYRSEGQVDEALHTINQYFDNFSENDLSHHHRDIEAAYLIKGECYYAKNDMSEALKNLKLVLEIAQQDENPTVSRAINIFVLIAKTYFKRNDDDQALLVVDYLEVFLNKRKNAIQYLKYNPLERIANIFYLQSSEHQRSEEYDRAACEFRSCLKVQMKFLPSDHQCVAETYDDIGFCTGKMRNYAVAVIYYQHAQNIWEKILPPNDPDLAGNSIRLGRIYHHLERYDDALSAFNKVSSAQLNVLTPEHVDIANIYKTIGNTYVMSGRFEEALPYFRKCLDIQLNSLPPNDLKLATTYLLIATLLRAQKEFSEAINSFQNALDIRLQYLSPTDSKILDIRTKLVEIYNIVKQYHDALIQYNEILKIQEVILSSNHIDIAKTHSAIADIHFKMENYFDASPHYQCTVNIHLIHLPTTSFDLISSLAKLGLTYARLDQFEDALYTRFECLEIQLNVLPSCHLNIATTYSIIAANYNVMQNYQNALLNYQECLDIEMSLLPSDDPRLADTYSSLATTFFQLGKVPDALTHYQLAIDIQLKHLPATSSRLILDLNMVAQIHSSSKRFEDSLSAYYQCLYIQLAVLPPQPLNIATTHERMGYIYFDTNQHEEARSSFVKCLDIRRNLLPPDHPDVVRIQSLSKALGHKRH